MTIIWNEWNGKIQISIPNGQSLLWISASSQLMIYTMWSWSVFMAYYLHFQIFYLNWNRSILVARFTPSKYKQTKRIFSHNIRLLWSITRKKLLIIVCPSSAPICIAFDRSNKNIFEWINEWMNRFINNNIYHSFVDICCCHCLSISICLGQSEYISFNSFKPFPWWNRSRDDNSFVSIENEHLFDNWSIDWLNNCSNVLHLKDLILFDYDEWWW